MLQNQADTNTQLGGKMTTETIISRAEAGHYVTGQFGLKKDLEELFELTGHPKAQELYDLAGSYGQAEAKFTNENLQIVILGYYTDMANLIKEE